MEYSKVYTAALSAGILPKVVLEKKIMAAGAWTPEDEAKIDRLGAEMREALANLTVAKTDDAKNAALMLFYEKRNTLMEESAKKQQLLQHTAESKGEEAKLTELMWRCVLKEDGSRVWENKDALLSQANSEKMARIIQEFVAFTTGLDEKIKSVDDLVKSSFEQEAKEEEKPQEEGKNGEQSTPESKDIPAATQPA